jgi:ribonuclease HII
MNIKKANREAMRRALEELLRKIPKEDVKTVAIDGNDNYDFNELDKKPIFVV